ncbi:uncharacterized protein eco [Epargyreus clarus]|uniref:uncharacterized protein eco n=1 Tax=Epargyreus clarus TaxID=520877 RepID=UPI003C2D94B9
MKSVEKMAETTPRRSMRLPHTHTPKMSERKKGLFQVDLEASRENLTKHRRLSVVDSESDSDDCDLGIISTLDSSSGDETDQNNPRTPERMLWRGSRSHSKKLIESQDLKNFMKSPFTLKKYQTRHCPESRCTGSLSTPATPHLQNHPGTPSSSHSCASVHTTSSTSSRARKSLASLIADTESCSSSLKDLNFDTDSGTDSKENTPTKSIRRSSRIHKLTPKFQSFKGILTEQKRNITPMKTAVVCLTKMDMSSMLSPTQMQKTPHNTSENKSPPKISHNRRSVVEIQESPESTCDSEKSHKRLHDGMSDSGPISKYPRLDPSVAPKARLSLFNSERLKEILSAKSFYGKSNPDLNTSLTTKLSNAIEATNTHNRRLFAQSHSHRRKRKPGQINMGVKHKIRKPKVQKKFSNMKGTANYNKSNNSVLNNSTISNVSTNKDTSMLSQNSSQELLNVTDKADPFDKEKQTIDALLSQWTEEEVPVSELIYSKTPKPVLPCFNSTVIEETSQIFEPVTAVPVSTQNLPQDGDSVIVELGTPQNLTAEPHNSLQLPQNVGQQPQTVELPQSSPTSDIMMVDSEGHSASHGNIPKNGHFLPVEGGYILVDGTVVPEQEEIPDLDEIERELKMLDEQILQMAQCNNINAEAVLASTETIAPETESTPQGTESGNSEKQQKLFSIFSKPNPGISTPSTKGSEKEKKLLKTGSDQYVIDAGQTKFGATQCNECGVIYQIGDPQDEHDHLVHHNATDVLRFNGWKEEFVVERTPTGRCLRVRGAEPGWKRVRSVLARVVHPSLGYEDALPREPHVYTAYLYIEKKQIVGCLIVEPKVKAYKLLPGDPDCCSVEDYPVKCGVSRIWVHASYRRQGLARRLLDCARASALHGTILRTQDLAFSAPTPAGKALATAYCDTPNFYVYLD